MTEPSSRKVYLVLSPTSLPYARSGLQTLLLHSLDALDVTLITDSGHDRELLLQATDGFMNPKSHGLRVVVQEELADREASLFAERPNLRHFRRGHPCWRKITDPLLMSTPAAEMVILDPDLYFPNRFRFEPTPAQGVLLMWQKPNCLLPPEVVHAAMRNGIPLARHVDIGVAHWRASTDLDWLEWMLGKLGGPHLPNIMHVEAIVWAAIAMQEGGGYLDPVFWRCWQRTAVKRLLRKLGSSGAGILRSEPWRDMKCFHGGGEAKWWIAEIEKQGMPRAKIAIHNEAGTVKPFAELTPGRYEQEESLKRRLRALDHFGVFR